MMRLTQTVQKGGCAAKVAASELRQILAKVRFPEKDSSIIVDGSLFDDAAIQLINDQLALVHTMDFFTPILDTPRLFGHVAAANALSDVYAMGGTPKTAMAILAFPVSEFEHSVVTEVLQGACDCLSEARVSLVGGHSIDDDTLKFGLSVGGFVHPQRTWTNSKAKAGDLLILTKALGTGTMTAALKRSETDEAGISEAIASMVLLNNAPEILGADLSSSVRAATDITGFGLLGHASHIAQASAKTLHFDFNQIPVFKQALSFLERGFLTKAHRTNREYGSGKFLFKPTLSAVEELILFDPQTSGGLLLCVDPSRGEEILHRLRARFPASQIIGRVSEAQSHALIIQ
jgi:selenide,water dikinase